MPTPNQNRPPKGAWHVSDSGRTVIGATNRSLGRAFGILCVALFLNGLLSLPGPGLLMNDENMSPGMTPGLWLILIPFILINLFLIGGFLSSLFGRTEVRIGNSQGTVFNGIGVLGWKSRFDPAQVKSVWMHRKHDNEGNNTFTILIEAPEGKQIKFGSLLTNERRQFVLAALRKTILR
jgi:hypothetical protein